MYIVKMDASFMYSERLVMAVSLPCYICIFLGGVISYIGSSGSSPSRTSPVSLYSECSTGSPQGGATHYPSYLPPSPTNSYSASPSSSAGETSPRSTYGLASSPGGLHVALDDGSRVSPSKTSSNITSNSTINTLIGQIEKQNVFELGPVEACHKPGQRSKVCLQ